VFWPRPTQIIEKHSPSVLALVEEHALAADGTLGVRIQVRSRLIKHRLGRSRLRNIPNRPTTIAAAAATTEMDGNRFPLDLAERDLPTASITFQHKWSPIPPRYVSVAGGSFPCPTH